jgi:hypothetical protein
VSRPRSRAGDDLEVLAALARNLCVGSR